jgi:predicted short-subunit dehydrogenase-like oxidoreductase (DUF2520 family)
MRQVPHYLIIGDGRVARHFRHYFSLLSIPFSAWHRGQSADLLPPLAQQASHILILINDSAIEDFIRDYLQDATALKIHFSGALVTDAAFGAHPLMTFNTGLYTLEKYRAISFVVEDSAPDFAALLPHLPNPHVRLVAAFKAKYHALCVLSGNFSCLLWQKLFTSFESEFGIPAATGYPYLQQQCENLISDYKTALTGPLVRGDTATLEKNLQALQGDAFAPIYQEFVELYPQLKEKK